MNPEAELETFILRFNDGIAAQIRATRAAMRARLPGAFELVYDNYNALAIGYGASEKLADMVFSVAAYPRWVSLFFSQGAVLEDPEGLLQGKGSAMRHIVLTGPEVLELTAVRALMDQALSCRPIDAAGPGRLILKSVSVKQRPRRP